MSPRAIFRKNVTGQQDTWACIENPAVLIARETRDVIPLLEQVEASAAGGLHALGYVSYEASSAFDPALVHHDADPGVPLAMFMIGEVGTTDLPPPVEELGLSGSLTRREFEESIKRIKAYLHEGDTYQVNFTHRYDGTVQGSAEAVFARLFEAQPSPLAVFLQHEDLAICSVSPELFFERVDDRIRCEPMKGTRPRGRYPQEDELIRQALAASKKDRAENLMIVDMIRNDLGRIAIPGSVKADELFSLRRLPTVWQKVSEVTARTSDSLPDVFRALFPCASITGAPKARTMQIIRELEDSPRGVYTGALGIVYPDTSARFSVGIRTLTMKSGRASYGVGGGIVWDSDPIDEWQESLTKAAVLGYRLPQFNLLETLLLEKDKGIRHLDRHLERLRGSADYFGYPCSETAIREKLDELVPDESVRVRLQLEKNGGLILERRPLPQTREPVRLRLAAFPVSSDNLFLYHKTTHREVYEKALAATADCDDVLLFNERSELTETTIFNVILELDGELCTPALSSGLLAGTWRAQMLADGKVRERTVMIDDLARATRLFVCNSLRGLLDAELLESDAAQYSLGGKPS